MNRFAVTPLVFTAILAAQIQTTAYVNQSTGGGYGHVAALGCSPTGLFAESHAQVLIPARYLPGPGAILLGMGALGSSSSGTNTVLDYASLRVAVSPTTATSLISAFAGNLPLPHVVLPATALRVDWQANAFTPITFVNTYTHDGQSSLVVDIQKVVRPIGDAGMKSVQNARRADLPRMIAAFGATGSGANTAVLATSTDNPPLSLELRWAGANGTTVPTVKLKSDAAAPLFPQFAIGRPLDLTVEAAPGSLAVSMVSLSLATPAVTFPGVVGSFWLQAPVTLEIASMDVTGSRTLHQTIPAEPALVNLYLGYQALVAEPTGTWRFTNVADCFVNSAQP